jgi:hypothetical protein
MRFARLSRIRVILGCLPDEVHVIPDADTFVEDEEYLILDLVLNWVSCLPSIPTARGAHAFRLRMVYS